MNILITNDDGIDAPGIAVLKRILSKDHNVFLVAPDKQHSGGSHRITFDAPVHVEMINPRRYSCDGTPADCTRIGLFHLFEGEKIDCVVSGINAGANLGMDLFLSGTVAAAREATFHGTKAIAISQYVGESGKVNWDKTEKLAALILQKTLSYDQLPGRFWNINLPDLVAHPEIDSIKSTECPVDAQPLPNHYHREGNRFVYLGRYRDRQHQPGTDIEVCLTGSVSVSLV
jgi:5'-nucleotidase